MDDDQGYLYLGTPHISPVFLFIESYHDQFGDDKGFLVDISGFSRTIDIYIYRCIDTYIYIEMYRYIYI